MQDKRPKNDKGEQHGYWEVYYNTGQLHFKGVFVNNQVSGKYQCYDLLGNLVLDCYTFNRQFYGCCTHFKEISYYAR